ncbi:phosphate-starvation-inducible PsiE family protein [Acidiphilium sp.]|uniref:phosphate-starvation-inducible PsiE family protein n=1 Tax=Acidiphilium sp. TaxID=527 RepID=UPI003D02B6A0
MKTIVDESKKFYQGDRIRSLIKIVAASFRDLTFYESFEHAIILVLTGLIILIIASATWHLAIAVVAMTFSGLVKPNNQEVFQTVFGMVFTVLIALEFKRSLLVVLARQESVVRVRSIILIAMLAMARKFIILDIGTAEEGELFGLSAAILSLGVVYWMVRDQDRRLAQDPRSSTETVQSPQSS